MIDFTGTSKVFAYLEGNVLSDFKDILVSGNIPFSYANSDSDTLESIFTEAQLNKKFFYFGKVGELVQLFENIDNVFDYLFEEKELKDSKKMFILEVDLHASNMKSYHGNRGSIFAKNPVLVNKIILKIDNFELKNTKLDNKENSKNKDFITDFLDKKMDRITGSKLAQEDIECMSED